MPDSDLILFYQTEDGKQRIEVHLQDESVWLSQKLMAELFQTTPQNINMHLKNIFSEGEVVADSVIKESLTTASDGKSLIRNISGVANFPSLKSIAFVWQTFLENNPFSLYDHVM